MNLYSNTAKILISFLVSVAMFGGVLIYLIYSISSINSDYRNLQAHQIARVEHLQDMMNAGLLGGIATRNKIFRPGLKVAEKVMLKTDANFTKNLKLVRELTPADATDDLKMLDEIAGHWTNVSNARKAVFADVAKKDIDTAQNRLVTDEHPNWQPIRKSLQVLIKHSKDSAAAAVSATEKHIVQVRSLGIVISLVALTIGFVLIFIVMRSLGRRLKLTTSALEEIAAGEGDLRQRLSESGKDEIADLARAFNKFVAKVQQLVIEITESTSQLASAAEEMSAITEETRANTRRQAEQTDMVAAAVNEMVATTRDIAQNTNETAAAAQETDSATRSGRDALSQSVSSVNDLAEQMERTGATVNMLEEQTTEIGKVLDVIRGVAEQTNLLALNAAIEAARAGEHGRGFAVVAEEVRSLASRTQQSTEEIRNIIETLQARANETAVAMQASNDRSQKTIEMTRSADESLALITKRVDAITQMTLQIAAAAEEQSAASEEINRNLSEIRSQSEHLDESSKQVSIAGTDLTRLASNLDRLVGRFKA